MYDCNDCDPCPPIPESKYVDLTQTIKPGIPFVPNTQKFGEFQSKTIKEDGFSRETYVMDCGTGTHIDFPSHFFIDGKNLDDYSLDYFQAPAIVIDVSSKAAINRNYALTVRDIKDWEKTHGKIPNKAYVLMRSGWGSYFDDPEKYIGPEMGGWNFPGIGGDASRYLLECYPSLIGVGTDTLSIDVGKDIKFETHNIMLGNGKLGIENLLLPEGMPGLLSQFSCIPLKFDGAPESPVRAFFKTN